MERGGRLLIVLLWCIEHDPAANSRRRKPGQEASKFKTDADTGKLMINDDSGDEGKPSTAPHEMDLEGRAYQDQLTTTEGQTRGSRGQVVFNKDTKRGRAREADGDAMVRFDCPPRLVLFGD